MRNSIVDLHEKINEYRTFFTIHKLTIHLLVVYNEQTCMTGKFIWQTTGVRVIPPVRLYEQEDADHAV